VWKPLLTVFSKESLLDKAYKDSYKMLALTEQMYLAARTSLRSRTPADIDIDIYESDAKVNKYERKIRKKVMQHLGQKGREDLYSGLLLVSVIIDMERIGDECKNVLNLAQNYHGHLKAKFYEEDLVKIESAVEEIFGKVRAQFKDMNIADAEKLLEEYRWVNKVCDQREADLIKEKNKPLPAAKAAAIALYIRHLKRINSHLRNIATSVVSPFDRIGFSPKPAK
jgi:phosphate transport system protein